MWSTHHALKTLVEPTVNNESNTSEVKQSDHPAAPALVDNTLAVNYGQILKKITRFKTVLLFISITSTLFTLGLTFVIPLLGLKWFTSLAHRQPIVTILTATTLISSLLPSAVALTLLQP